MTKQFSFKNLFSAQAAEYARYRPTYPPKLFEFLSSLVDCHERAWDCGTGNGQAAVELARHFKEVIATDPSEKQIKNAVAHPKVRYRVEPAEKTSLEAKSVDLVTAAQAAHWFDHERFNSEVRRVAKPGAVIALWSYGHNREITPEIDRVVRHFSDDVVGSYWAPEIRHVWAGYRTIPFPFEEIAAPKIKMESELTLDGLIGYLSSWSSTTKFIEENGANPIEGIVPALHEAWGDSATRRRVVWHLSFRIGRV